MWPPSYSNGGAWKITMYSLKEPSHSSPLPKPEMMQDVACVEPFNSNRNCRSDNDRKMLDYILENWQNGTMER
jgi:hypothetical protein